MPDQIDNKYTIASSFSAITNSGPAQKRKGAKKKTKAPKRFSELVQEQVLESEASSKNSELSDKTKEADELLIKLQDEVFSKGDVLKHKVTLETIKDYKDAVSAFLAYFVSHTYDFQKTPVRRTSFRSPKSSSIRLINEKLEKLANEIFINQARQLDILEKVDEIKGLIIDLLQ